MKRCRFGKLNGSRYAEGIDLDAGMDSIELLSREFLENERFVDDPATADTAPSPTPIVDACAVEFRPGVACPADLAISFGVFGFQRCQRILVGPCYVCSVDRLCRTGWQVRLLERGLFLDRH